MAEYSKKLHIRKNSIVTDIKLYTTTTEVGTDYLTLKDGATPIYAKLGTTTDTNASDLRVRKNGTVYAVLTQAAAALLYNTLNTLGTGNPTLAFDGNTTNAVATGTNMYMDFGTTARLVNRVKIVTSQVQVGLVGGIPTVAITMNQAYLRYSDDNVNWTTVQTLGGMVVGDNLTYTWDITSTRRAARYWSLFWDSSSLTQTVGGYRPVVGAREITLYGQ